MDGVVTDTKLIANQAMFTGGGAVGFIWEKNDVGAGAGVGPANRTYRFTGNKDVLRELQNLDPGAIATRRCSIDVIRLDTYANAVTRPLAADHILCDADAPATLVAGGTGDSELYIEECGNGSLVLSGLAGNYAAMVVVRDSGQFAGGVSTPDATAKSAGLRVISAPSGNYQHLGAPSHFTVDRSLADNAPLRSTIQCIDGTNTAPQKLNFGRMQNMLDEIMIAGGEDPQCIYVHPGMRQEYASLLIFQAASGSPTTFY